jgi:predicted RNase H-like HicB family nuclease
LDLLKAIVKRIKSYSKAHWELDDYPITIWRNPHACEDKVAFGAGILRWATMIGHGETPEKALTALKENFKLYNENHDSLPRPGTKVPFEYVSTDLIDKYEKTAVDFFKRVLHRDYYNGFYSDMSSLVDFMLFNNYEKANEFKSDIINRTILLYHVDITDVYDEPLWKIFEKIQKRT